jgi:hypothetical protein
MELTGRSGTHNLFLNVLAVRLVINGYLNNDSLHSAHGADRNWYSQHTFKRSLLGVCFTFE